jgi:hypothetical protein
MFSLGTRSRGMLVAGALLAFAAAYATTPIVARSAAAPLVPVPSLAPSSPLATPLALVIPRRDPFSREPGAAAAPSRSPALSGLPAIPALIGALPPNPSAVALIPPPAVRVTAIVSGSRPYALVDENGSARIVAAGDSLGGQQIKAIRPEGIRLAHGALLPIAPAPSDAPRTALPALPLPPSFAHSSPLPGSPS